MDGHPFFCKQRQSLWIHVFTARDALAAAALLAAWYWRQQAARNASRFCSRSTASDALLLLLGLNAAGWQ
jgi:hypothetical protein